MLIFTLTALALAASGQSQPQDADQPKSHKEHKSCRTEETTGSNMSKRICHTAEEWRELDKNSGVDENQMNHLRSQMH